MHCPATILPRRRAEPSANRDATAETLSDLVERERLASNRRRPRSVQSSLSDWIGVCRTVSGLWYARIWTGTKWQPLGFWEEAEDAAREYDRAARAMYGPFVAQNFPVAPGLTPSCDPEADGLTAQVEGRCAARVRRARA